MLKLKTFLLSFFKSEIFLYILKRTLQAILTLFLASILSFIIVQLAPGSFIDYLANDPRLTPERKKVFIALYNLDKPLFTQYWSWLIGVVTRFDFGYSFLSLRPVGGLLVERIPATLLLSLFSILLTWLIAIPLGILGAVKQNTFLDKFLRVISYMGQGVPSFLTALLLLILAQLLSPLFPVGGMTSINYSDFSPLEKIIDVSWHLVFPTLALTITSFAGLQRITRGQLLDVLRQDYIQTARAKGLSENRVLYIHALRNAINPLITLLGFEFASLLSGAFIAENFFNWPGLGRLILQAVQSQDLYVVMASLMMGATLLILGNLLADLMLKFADPRIRLEDL